MLFTDQIFKTSLQQKAQPSIYFKIPDEFFQTLVRWLFEALIEKQKLDREFQKFDKRFKELVRVIKKVDHMFAL